MSEKRKFKASNSDEATSKAEELFEYTFLDKEPNGYEFISVDPNSLILPPFDSRAADGIIDKQFKDSIKQDGVINPITVAPVIHKITQEFGYLVVAGRRRTRASREIGLKEVPCQVKPTTLLKAKILAGVENIRRQDMTAWDMACYFRDLRDGHGLSGSDIKKLLDYSDATISQYLSIFDLAEPVQNLIQTGKLGANAGTKVRFLKMIENATDQFAVAELAINKGWNTVALDEYVKKYLAKNNLKTAGTGKPGRKRKDRVQPSEYYKIEDFKIVSNETLHSLMMSTAQAIDEIRASTTPNEEKLKYHIGKLDAFKQMVGLKDIPKSLIEDQEDHQDTTPQETT